MTEYQFDRGDVIANRYGVADRIGAGGMCTVYLVDDRIKKNRRIALKLISDEVNAVKIETFRNEFKILSHLKHENLISVFDFGVLGAGQGFFYTAEFIDGKDLWEATREIPEDDLIEYIVHICRALEYVHNRGYIHYDVKPSNVLIAADGIAKLTDFGLSALADRALGQRIRGTPAYTSPEVIACSAIDHRADLYSLGITLYEITTGITPFRGGDLHDLFHRHVTELPAPPREVNPDMPEYLEKVILKLLAKNPAERYSSANGIIRELASGKGIEIELQPVTSIEGYLQTPPMRGREEVMETLRDALAELAGGKAGNIYVKGPPGIGRSRLLRELNFEAQLMGFATAMVNAGDADLFTSLAADLSAHPAVEAPVGSKGSEIHSDPSSPDSLPEAAAGLIEIAGVVPAVICIDDLQAADPVTFSHLSKLIRVLDTSAAPSLLLVMTVREGDGVELPESAISVMLPLSPLEEGEVGEVVAGMFGNVAPPELFISRLYETVSGNPHAVVETVRMLVFSDNIRVVEGKWAFQGGVEPFKVAGTLEGFYRKQADSLRGLEHKLAYSVALMDRSLSMYEISSLHDEPPEKLAAVISGLDKKGIIRRVSGKVEIASRGVRDAVTATRGITTQKRRHGEIADRLIKTRKGEFSKLEIARHYLFSGRKKEGIRVGLAAIDSGEIRKRDAAAIAVLQRLRKAAKEEANASRVKILCALAAAVAPESNPREMVAVVEEYRQVVTRREPRARRARMERLAAICHGLLNEQEKAERAWTEALRYSEPGSEAYMETLIGYTKLLQQSGALIKCEEILENAVSRFGEKKNRTMIRVWIALCHITLQRGNNTKAVEYVLRANDLAEELSIEKEAEFEILPGLAAMVRFDFDAAEKHLEKARKIAAEQNDYYPLAYTNMNLVLVCFRLNKIDRALQLTTEAEGIYRKHADIFMLTRLYSFLGGEIQTVKGSRVALGYLEKGLEFARAAGAGNYEYSILTHMGEFAGYRGDFKSTYKYADAAIAMSRKVLKGHPHVPMMTKADALRIDGRFKDGLELVLESIEETLKVTDPTVQMSARIRTCYLAVALGMLDLFQEQLGLLYKITPSVQKPAQLGTLLVEALMWFELGVTGRAAEILKQIMEEIDEIIVDTTRGHVFLLEGRIEALKYNFEKAEAAFRRARNLIDPDVRFETYFDLLRAEVELELFRRRSQEAEKRLEILETTLSESLPNESRNFQIHCTLLRSRIALLAGDRQKSYNEAMSGFLEAKGIGFRLLEIEFIKIAAETSPDHDESENLGKDLKRIVEETVSGLSEEVRETVRERMLSAPRETISEQAPQELSDIGDSADALLQLAVFLARENEPQRAVNAIIDAAFKTMNAERVFLAVFTEEGLEFSGGRYKSGKEPEEPEKDVSKTIINRVVETGTTILSEKAKDETVFASFQSIIDLELLSLLAAPLWIGGKACGCLYLDNSSTAGAFSDSDRRRAEYLASLAGTVLERQFMLQQMKEKTEGLSYLLERQSAEFEIIRQELDETRRTHKIDNIIGQSAEIRRLREDIRRAAETDFPVMFTGEIGTGKSLAAQVLHDISARAGRFITVNCGAIPESLFLAELFGVERGAFTGADETKPGLFELADRGTCFLDQIADLDVSAQKALLRAVAEGKIRRVGGRDPISVDVRIISAVNQDVSRLMDREDFRSDLLYRLNAIEIHLPPLRNCREDISMLASRFLSRIASGHERSSKPLSLEAVKSLESYSWPGNVRELRNVLERAFVVSDERIETEHLGLADKVTAEIPHSNGPAISKPLKDIEREQIIRVLKACDGDLRKTAGLLEISVKTLRRKITKYRSDGYLAD
jgi:transcriptional regulator with GAF, ATPase, and Fis domain